MGSSGHPGITRRSTVARATSSGGADMRRMAVSDGSRLAPCAGEAAIVVAGRDCSPTFAGLALHNIERILRKEGVLARHAERLTTHLEQALALAEEDDAIYSDSSLYLASIKAHDQNRHRETGGLGHLIDLVRDAYLEVAAIDRARAENLLRRWVLSRKPLFTRLALHALTEDPKSDINLARTLLLTRRGRVPGRGVGVVGASVSCG